jgi:hypothetical protein
MKLAYLISIGLMAFASLSHAQTQNPNQTQPNWQLLKEEAGVKIYYSRDLTCLNPNALVLKIDNGAALEAKVDWVLPENLNQAPMNKSNAGTINVAAGKSVAAGCNTTAPIQLTLIVTDSKWVPDAKIFSITLIPAEK